MPERFKDSAEYRQMTEATEAAKNKVALFSTLWYVLGGICAWQANLGWWGIGMILFAGMAGAAAAGVNLLQLMEKQVELTVLMLEDLK